MNILVTKDLRYIYVGNEYVQLPSEYLAFDIYLETPNKAQRELYKAFDKEVAKGWFAVDSLYKLGCLLDTLCDDNTMFARRCIKKVDYMGEGLKVESRHNAIKYELESMMLNANFQITKEDIADFLHTIYLSKGIKRVPSDVDIKGFGYAVI